MCSGTVSAVSVVDSLRVVVLTNWTREVLVSEAVLTAVTRTKWCTLEGLYHLLYQSRTVLGLWC